MVRFLVSRLNVNLVPGRLPSREVPAKDPFRRKSLAADVSTIASRLLPDVLRQSMSRLGDTPSPTLCDIGAPAERKDSPNPVDPAFPLVIVPLHAWGDLLSSGSVARTAIKVPAADHDPSRPASAPRLSALMIAMLG